MKAMILAAGKGERMRPLTEHTPKPLLKVGGKALLEYHLEGLVGAGFRELVINVSWLGEQIVDFLGARDWGCDIAFSREAEPLETAGGIVQALPLLGDAPFALVNADVWTDYPFDLLRGVDLGDCDAHLVLVDNPPQHPGGDFRLQAGRLDRADSPRLTYSGVGVYSPRLFSSCVPGKQPLLPLFEAAIERGALAGEHYRGRWEDVGTPERLAALDAQLGIH